jgi:penicillin-binding protein 1A
VSTKTSEWALRNLRRANPFLDPLDRLGRRLLLHRVTDLHLKIVAVLSLALAVYTWQRCGLDGCPNVSRLSAFQPGGATVLLDRHGQRFADLAPVRRQVVSLKSLPEYVAQAFIAVEDKRFYRHNGVDWGRVLGAGLANLKARGWAQGSSTITMQLARNLFPRELPQRERTMRRKLLEVRVASSIEREYTKNEILELYLNHIYFGNGAYGIEAAAQQYFGRHARELTLSQTAVLAALPKAPAHYDPRRRPTRAKTRRNLVLALMEQQGRITSRRADVAMAAGLRVTEPRRGAQEDGFAPYFVDAVRKILEDKYGDLVYERRLRVRTTLDVRAQRAVEEEIIRQLQTIESGELGDLNGPAYSSAGASNESGTRYLQASAVILEVASGDIIAMVGGRDFLDSPFNRATQSHRQVGSAFKPFVFATAIAKGFAPSQHIVDEPMTVQVSRQVVWEPRNYDGEFYGEISLRRALVESRNVPTVRLAEAVGLNDIKTVAQRAGFTGDLAPHPSMPLGTVASSPLELAHAYTVFPGLGTQPDPRYILSVENEKGKTIWEPETNRSVGTMDPGIAYIVTDMLRDVVDEERGTGTAVRAVGFRGAAAGKTGTTSENSDTWFVGFTPDLVGTVWVGFDQQREILPDANGGRLAAPIWGNVMRRVYETRADPGDFKVPDGIVHRMVDPTTGLVLEDGCYPNWGDAQREVFLSTWEVEETCPAYGASRWITGILRGIQGAWERDVEPSIDDIGRKADEVGRKADELLRGEKRDRKHRR